MGANLTPSELEVLAAVARGLTAREIAAERFVSPHTVMSQLREIRRKLDAPSIAASVDRAHRRGLL